MRRLLTLLALVALLAAGAGAYLWMSGRSDDSSAAASTDETPTTTDTETVTRRTLTEQADATGQVGYDAPTNLAIGASGTVTAAPEQNDVLSPGDEAIRIDDKPVTLVKGDVPLYRELRRVPSGERDAAGDKIGLLEGDDVLQLQRYLLSEGFDDSERLEADGIFGLSTERAVKAWQKDRGLPATGKIDNTQMVFIDGPVRVDSAPEVGANFETLSVTGQDTVVTTTINARQRPYFAQGSTVELEGNGTTVEGTVSKITRQSGAEGQTSYSVEIGVTDDLGDAEAVKVIATRIIVEDVLTVPARALVALADGGWAVQVPDSATGGTRLQAVELGEVVDGFAEITGLDEGDTVVVPV